MEFIFIVGLIALIYFGYQFFKTKKQYDNPNGELKKLYADKYTDNDQIKMSYFVLAGKFGCMPDKVKENYILELEKNNFDFAELLETEKNWRIKKLEESVSLGIKPQNTPAALLEKWTLEFRNNNF
ncbi:hypothetical protein ACT3CD_10375 [Geofilum sp. OHC36d9]|uniref:hypothetical protein n=1 Tax=Geofilum sp. OHC36d9 TaxID=3458413 RepID=UPI0040340E7A